MLAYPHLANEIAQAITQAKADLAHAQLEKHTLQARQKQQQQSRDASDALFSAMLKFPLKPDRDRLRDYIDEIRLDQQGKFRQVVIKPGEVQALRLYMDAACVVAHDSTLKLLLRRRCHLDDRAAEDGVVILVHDNQGLIPHRHEC